MQARDHPPLTGTGEDIIPSSLSAAVSDRKTKKSKDGSGPSAAPKPSCCTKAGLKRGSWTPEEDELLAQCVKREGEGRWRTLPKRAGLLRCGKSCRLRWMNYLRPSVRRGRIGPDEEDLILRLHRLLGNRWSLIAGRLPGRTDNEIKNYWNTYLSKKLISHGIDPRTHKPLIADTNTDTVKTIAVPWSQASSSKSYFGRFLHDTPLSVQAAARTEPQYEEIVARAKPANPNPNCSNSLPNQSAAFPSFSDAAATVNPSLIQKTGGMIIDDGNFNAVGQQVHSYLALDNGNLDCYDDTGSINFHVLASEVDDLSSLLCSFIHEEGGAIFQQQESLQQPQPSTDDSNYCGSGCSDEFPIYSAAAALMLPGDFGHGSIWGLPDGPEGTSKKESENLQFSEMDRTATMPK